MSRAALLLALALTGCGESFGPDWSACFGGPRVVERGGFQAPPPGSIIEPKRYPERPTPDAGAGRTR